MLICLIFIPLLFKIQSFQDMVWKMVGQKVASNEEAIEGLTNLTQEDVQKLIKKAVLYLIMGLTVIPFVISTAVFIYLPLDEGFQKSCSQDGQNLWLMSFIISLAINFGIILLSPSISKYVFIKGVKDSMSEPILKAFTRFQEQEVVVIGCIAGFYMRTLKYFLDEKDILWCNICCPDDNNKVKVIPITGV